MRNRRRIAIQLDLEWPYKRHAELFAGTQRYAREKGWESILEEFMAENLATLRSKSIPYDGVIARASEKLATNTARLGIPLVNVWFSSPVWAQLPGVFPDFSASGRIRAEHLLNRGLRRFAVVVRDDRGRALEAAAFSAAVKEAGFSCVMAKMSLNPVRNYNAWLRSQQLFNTQMNKWQLPIGVSVDSESIGRLIVQRCIARGWRVPQDVAIIAGSNEDVLCENPRPSLSSTDFNYEQIGYEAAKLLDKLIDRKESGRHTRTKASLPHILLPPAGLVIRESTDFYAIDDETVSQALRFIAEKSHSSISLSDVARFVGLEPRTLQRHFARVLGRTVTSEICRVRVERAKRELVQSDRSLKSIALEVGFGTRRQMYEVFCRELGVTPRTYRKQRHLVDRS